MNSLAQFLHYAQKVFGLNGLLRGVRCSRPYPEIPTGAVLLSLLMGAVLRVGSYQNRGFSPLSPPPATEPKKEEPPEPTPNMKDDKQEILPISLYAETPEREPKRLSKQYAPFGRLIPCELIITVDSSSIRTPIVGLVTEDIYHAGRLIIPAATEVHGTAQTDRMRERIASGNRWTLVSPLFIGFLAVPTLRPIGCKYCLNLVGIMLWPLGWGVAGLITEGMIDFMTDRSFLSTMPIGGDSGYSLQNLLGIAFLGVWLIFSTIAAPMAMQKALIHGTSMASALLAGAFSAGRSAMASGASTLARTGTGASGIKEAIAAAAISTAAAGESLGSASISEGAGGGESIVRSLAAMQSRSGLLQSKPVMFPKDDPFGNRTVAESIRKNRSPFSQS